MLAPMERQNYNRAIRQNAKVYGIWETPQHGSSGFAMSAKARGLVTMRSTIASTALANSAPSPSRRSSYLRRVSRTSSSASGRKTTRRVTLLPTTSGELRTRGPLFRAQRQFPLALVVGQTLPQRHRQVGAIAGGSLNSCASTLDSMA